MRIGVNCRELLSHRLEGIGRFTLETTKRMVLDHPDDEFIFFFDRPFDEQFIFADNITPVVISPQARHPILWYIWFEISLKNALKKHKVDVFYSGDTYLSLGSNVPTLLICHDIAYAHYPEHIRWSHLQYYKHYFPKFHHRADHIVAVSNFTRQDIISKYHLDTEKVSVGYNATPRGFKSLSPEERQKQRVINADGHPYFIFVGSLHPRKNLVSLILAFDKFKSMTKSSHKLILVGRFAWKNKELKDTLDQISHQDDIIMKGNVFDGIQNIVAGSEGLVYISLFEGFGIPILEGFSSHVPVITSTVSSMPEVAGEHGYMVDPLDINMVAKTMSEIVKNPRSPEKLQAAADWANKFTWKRTADHIYDKLIEIAP